MEKNRDRSSRLPTVSRNLLETSRHFNRLFDDWFSLAPFGPLADEGGVFNEMMEVPEIEEQGDHYLMSVDLPGVPKENIGLEITGNRLTIRAEREDRDKGRGRTRSYGRFEQTLVLPQEVESTKVEADYRDGVLRIAFPKSATEQARTVPIGQHKEGFFSRLFEKAGGTLGGTKADSKANATEANESKTGSRAA